MKEIKNVLGRQLGRDARGIERSAVAGRSGHREHEDDLHAGARGDDAGLLPGDPVSAQPARRRRCFRSSPRGSSRPSSRPARCSAPGRWRRSTTWSPWPKGTIAPPKNLNIRFMQQVPDESLTFQFHFTQYAYAARGRLGSPRLHGNARGLPDAQRALEVLGRRPARGVQELGGGREHPPPARRGARASTSASCSENCCAVSR